jgi:hypothetical protein
VGRRGVPGHRPGLIQSGLLLRSVQVLRRRVGRGSAIWSPEAQFPGLVYRRRKGWWRLSPLFDEGAQNFNQINLSILPLFRVCCRPDASLFTSSARDEKFTEVAGVVLLVEKCEESEVSELRSREQRGVVQERLHFVCTQLL